METAMLILNILTLVALVYICIAGSNTVYYLNKTYKLLRKLEEDE